MSAQSPKSAWASRRRYHPRGAVVRIWRPSRGSRPPRPDRERSTIGKMVNAALTLGSELCSDRAELIPTGDARGAHPCGSCSGATRACNSSSARGGNRSRLSVSLGFSRRRVGSALFDELSAELGGAVPGQVAVGAGDGQQDGVDILGQAGVRPVAPRVRRSCRKARTRWCGRSATASADRRSISGSPVRPGRCRSRGLDRRGHRAGRHARHRTPTVAGGQRSDRP